MQQVDPQNILVIHFGQLGDVVLAIPAFRAIRKHYPHSKLTVISGRSTYGVVKLANIADEQIGVDRVALRDGNMVRSVGDILKLVKEVRGRRFDLVIDLHSLYETNILGYLSGARHRLFAHRDRRTIERFSNFPVKPPREDRSLHHTDRYLGVIEALGITDAERQVSLESTAEAALAAKRQLEALEIDGRPFVGFFLGAGHPARRWPVERFIDAANELSPEHRILVLLGPEENNLRPGLDEAFGSAAAVVPELPLDVFVATLANLDVLVSGDTGPMHLGAAAGAGIVLLSQKGAPDIFRPLSDRLVVIDDRELVDIDVKTVVDAVRKLISAG